MIKLLNHYNDGFQECVVYSKKDISKLKRSIRTYMALQGWAASPKANKKLNHATRTLEDFVYPSEKSKVKQN